MVSSHSYCTACGAANEAYDAFCFACGRPLRATLPSQQYPVVGSANSAHTGLLTPHLLLKQRYRISSQVGKGGFSAVYKVEDIQFGNRLLAVKEMSQSGLSPQEIVEATDAFKREALLLAGLKHPHLPSIYDHFSEAGRWYLVMDFIEGETLEEHLNNAKGKRLPVEKVLQIGIDLCGVLSYLHTRQPTIIFRDLKPMNVILTPEGHLYLIDFGIARHFKPGQIKDTIAFGSPGYAAPEQYSKTQSTPRADIYSLGVTLHQLLTGSDPSQTPFQFAPLQLQGHPTPHDLEPLIMQMLDMNESKRPASMIDIKQKLQRIVIQQAALESQAVIEHSRIQVSPPESKTTVARTVKKAMSSQQAQYIEKKNDKSLLLQDFESETELVQQIVLDRPRFWEYQLTAELLKSKSIPIKRRLNDLKKGLVYKKATPIRGNEFLGWGRSKFRVLSSLTVNALNVATKEIPESWGLPGVAGEPLEIKSAIDKLIFICNEMLDWETDVRFVIVPKQLEPLKKMMEGWTMPLIDEINSLSDRIAEPFKQPNPKGPINIHLTFNAPAQTTEFLVELQRLQKDPKLASILQNG